MDGKRNVDELIERLPRGYEQACEETKAIERKREIKTAGDLIRLVLLYLTGGYSQLEMSVIALEQEIAKISDTAFSNKFAKCREWIAWMISRIVPSGLIEYAPLKAFEEYQIVALDASDVTEKGRSRRTFRLHYAIDLINMCSLSYKVTAQNTGETLLNFKVKRNWLILADRIYGTLRGIEHCMKAEAKFILRLRRGAFKLYDAKGAEIELLEKLKGVTSSQARSIEVYGKLRSGLTRLRVCAIKIPKDKIEGVERRNKRRDSKKQRTVSSEALEMSGYVVVITNLPNNISAEDIVSLYKYRWQVEIYFKRLKSILDFGNVPLHREDSIHTWLNGKLLISFLIEQMISEVSFPPRSRENTQYLEGDTDYLSDDTLRPLVVK